MTKKTFTPHILLSALAIPLLFASSGQAANVGVDIHFGFSPPPVVVVPRPVYRQPVPTFYFSERPEFVYSPFLSFFVAVGSPYDLFYDNSHYYIFHQGYWHRALQLQGPWVIVSYHSLPPAFHRHQIEQIRRYRDREFDVYRYHRPSHPDRGGRQDKDHRGNREERR